MVWKTVLRYQICAGAVQVRFQGTSKVPEGATATVLCTADGSVTQWTKGPRQTILPDSRFQFSQNKKNLMIFNVQKSDEGSYYCHVQKSNGVVESGHARLDVLGESDVAFIFGDLV